MFGLGAAQPLDQVNLGTPPAWSPTPVTAPAPAPASAQDAQPSQTARALPDPYKPSVWDIAQGVIFDGQSPAEAAMAARQRAYQTQSQAILLDALQKAPPELRLPMLLNSGETGKALADRLATHVVKGGETLVNGGPGGSPYTAPLMNFDDKSGAFTTQLPDSVRQTGSLGGDFSAKDGIISSGRTGEIANRYGLPQLKPLGSSLESFLPGVSKMGGAGSISDGGAGPGPAGGAPTPATSPLAGFNFGNVKPLPNGQKWDGQTGVDARGYATFATPQAGAKAALTNLQSYAKQGINTPMGIAARWAPKGDGKNDPVAYGHFLAGQLGVGPNDPLDLNDPKTQKQLLQGIFSMEQGPQTMKAWRYPAPGGSPAQPAGSAQSEIHTMAGAQTPRILSQAEAKGLGYAEGTIVERQADGTTTVRQAPQYDSAWDRGQRDSFVGWEPVKQYTAVVKPSYDALIKNIGQMTGPAAYAILDTTIRTDNPGATTRQAQLDSFEHKFGLSGALLGQLLNYQGKGSIPKDIQQKIVNSMVPFAQAHYDAAKSLYDAQVSVAKAHGRSPDDLTIPLGDRPEGMSLTVPPPQQRAPGMYLTPKGPMKWDGKLWHPVP